MARKISEDTSKKMTDALIAQGIEPTFDVGKGVRWTGSGNERQLLVTVTDLPVKFSSKDGVKWVASFPMLRTENASGIKVSTKGYVTEATGGSEFKSAWDHATISLGRQLCGVADLMLTSTDVPQDVAAVVAENKGLRERDVVATVMEFVYMDDREKITEITPELWARVPEALRAKIAVTHPDLVPTQPEISTEIAAEVAAVPETAPETEPVAAGKSKK